MVHTFSALGCKIAVDVNSGAVHILDDVSYALLQAAGERPERMPVLDGYEIETCRAAWAELMELKEQGLLYTDDDYVNPAMAIVKTRRSRRSACM